jgi:hypothetical protein
VTFHAACIVLGEPETEWDVIDSAASSSGRFWEDGDEAVPPTLRAALLRESVIAVDLEHRGPCPIAGDGLEEMRSLLAVGT